MNERETAANIMARAAAPAFAAALCIAFLPPELLFVAPLAAIAVSLYYGFRTAPRARRGDAVFAPDPLAPDFKPLLKTVRSMLEAAKAQGRRGRIVMTPMPAPVGGFAPYSLCWSPKDNAIEADWNGGKTRLRSAVPVRIAAPMPIRVMDHPVAVSFGHDSRSGRVAVSTGIAARNALRSPRTDAWLLYLAALLLVARLRAGDGRVNLMSVAIFAAMPVIVRRLADFYPRFMRAAKTEFAFARNLARRFFGRI